MALWPHALDRVECHMSEWGGRAKTPTKNTKNHKREPKEEKNTHRNGHKRTQNSQTGEPVIPEQRQTCADWIQRSKIQFHVGNMDASRDQWLKERERER